MGLQETDIQSHRLGNSGWLSPIGMILFQLSPNVSLKCLPHIERALVHLFRNERRKQSAAMVLMPILLAALCVGVPPNRFSLLRQSINLMRQPY